jgi:ubiquinone/menaquinone biosynthesis C-methylase UbiE
MSSPDNWSDPSAAGAVEAAEMAAFLETRGQFPDQVEVDRTLQTAIAPVTGENLLEVGSGSGLLCRQAGANLGPDGTITGVDISIEMITTARQLAARQNLGTRIYFAVASAERLPYADSSFEGAFAARLLLHLEDPDVVLNEMVRVVRPGGRIILMDWDFETVTVDHPDRELTRRLLNWRTDHYGSNNWSGRQLFRRAQQAGLKGLWVNPVVTIARDESAGFTHTLWRAAQRACDAGAISPREQAAWTNDLKTYIAQGRFFASITYFIVRGIVEKDP